MEKLEFSKVYDFGKTKKGGLICFTTSYNEELLNCQFDNYDWVSLYVEGAKHAGYSISRVMMTADFRLTRVHLVRKSSISKMGIIIKFPTIEFEQVFESETMKYDETLFSKPVKKQAR